MATVELPRAFPAEACGSTLPAWKQKLMSVCWGLFWLPLFPQGLVAMFMKIFGADERSWFLALYMPEPLQWPVIIGMIALGAGMVWFAAKAAQQAKERDDA